MWGAPASRTHGCSLAQTGFLVAWPDTAPGRRSCGGNALVRATCLMRAEKNKRIHETALSYHREGKRGEKSKGGYIAMANMTRYNPLNEVVSLREAMEHLFEDSFIPRIGSTGRG